jgi:membrane protease YdiL (CAAX protease family)
MTAALVMTLLCVAGGAALALRGGHGGFPLVVTAVAFGAYLFPVMAFLFGDFAERSRRAFAANPARLFAAAAVCVVIQLLYGVGTGTLDLDASARFVAFLFIPCLIVTVGANRPVPSWLDLLAVACIWLPFDTGHLKGIWAWPAGDGAYVLNTAVAISLAGAVFVGFRGLEDVKIRLRWSRADVVRAVLSLLAFMVLAVPFGLLTDFIKLNPRVDLMKAIGTPLGIFFFIAIPEELLFRGLVQNILEKKLKRFVPALILASVFFGATHYNNTPTPDWRYLTLATLAGFLYGYNYWKSRSLLGSALMHALVDSVWVLFFMNEAIKGGSGG